MSEEVAQPKENNLEKQERRRERQTRRRQRQTRRRQERRDNVVMVRVDEQNLKRIDELVESGQFNSRSEATAFLISEGVKSKQQMFEKMATKISQIQGLRTELAEMIAQDTQKPSTNESDNVGADVGELLSADEEPSENI